MKDIVEFEFSRGDAVTILPQGATGLVQAQTVFSDGTHGFYVEMRLENVISGDWFTVNRLQGH